MESVAQIGSYSLDIRSGHWVGSKGLDAIFGIDASFERSVESWVSIVHPADRKAMLVYFTDEVLARRRPFERQYRIVRQDTGDTRWVRGRGALTLDASGRPIRMLGTIADITELHSLEALEHKLIQALDQTADAVVIVNEAHEMEYANPAVERLIGPGIAHLASGIPDRLASEQLPATSQEMARMLSISGAWVGDLVHPQPDGTNRISEASINPLRDSNGAPSGHIVVARDVTNERARDAERDRLAAATEQSIDGIVITDRDWRIVYTNAAYAASVGQVPSELVGRSAAEVASIGLDAAAVAAMYRAVAAGQSWVSEVDHRLPDGSTRRFEANIAPSRDASGAISSWIGTIRDVTEHYRSGLEMRRLWTAIEQSAEAVVITDAAGAIEYVNPAFERTTGYLRDEVRGQNPRILKSGVQGPDFYAEMWATLTSGHSFAGELTNRRKDGSLFQEDAVISPIVGNDGAITSYVAVKRDVTRERESESARQRTARERALIAEGLGKLRVMPTTAATAEAICRQVVGLTGAVSATLSYFAPEGHVAPIAFIRADDGPAPLRRIPHRRSQALRERADGGPWVEAWSRRPWHPYDALFRELGIVAVAAAPVRLGGELLGLLSITSAEADAVTRLTETLPSLLEIAGFAGALVGPGIRELTKARDARGYIADILKGAAFGPVFQPIVELATGACLGFEALTRFSSGAAPDSVFADAWAAGLGAEIELATLAASVKAAEALPPGGWLSVNVSPGLVTANGRLAAVLLRADRPVVLEVTEHVAVEDYAVLRTAVRRLRPTVRVAVDDAGAGVANFSHLVELRPAFVKLDIGLVRGIESDRTRQALVLGLLHFARDVSSEVIAEGVETEEELATLKRLGVPLAQGYLLGRPEPVETWAAATPPARRSAGSRAAPTNSAGDARIR